MTYYKAVRINYEKAGKLWLIVAQTLSSFRPLVCMQASKLHVKELICFSECYLVPFQKPGTLAKNNSLYIKQFTIMAEEKKDFLGYPSFQEFSQVGKMMQQITGITNTVVM